QGRQHGQPGFGVPRQHGIDHLADALRLQRQAVFRAIRRTHPRVQQPQVIVDFGDGAHGGPWIVARRLLLDGDRRRQALDEVDVGLVHQLQELPRVGRQAFDVAALPFGIQRVEGQRRFARAGQARDDHELVTRQVERDVFEIMGAGTPNAYRVHRAVCGFKGQLGTIARRVLSRARHCPYVFCMPADTKLKLTSSERRASVALAGLFACRMLGLFLLLPVFAVAAGSLPGGDDPMKVGLALGMYGLTQAFMQIPFGLASDRWGRRPVVVAGLLLFIAGSVVCALAHDVFWITIGRAIQGAGAISAAVTAWLADATRDAVRTRAMAMVGASIGLSFALSLVLAPVLVGWWGLPGLFWTIACLGVASLAVARWVVPVVPRSEARSMQVRPGEVLAHRDMLRLNFGVFALHCTQVALFVVVPALLAQTGGWGTQELWKVYLPIILVSFVLMVPVIFVAERHRAHRAALRASVAGLAAVCALLPAASHGFYTLAIAITAFFVVFNILEALQPSLVSRVAPAQYKGLAPGFYNTAQAAGLFCGGALGGWLAARAGADAVFLGAAALAAVWLAVTWALKPLP